MQIKMLQCDAEIKTIRNWKPGRLVGIRGVQTLEGL